MKTDVEELSPTRVKLTIAVPFEELKPSLDKAYREVARQVRIKGFRPGRVPPRILDSYVGREVVLEQAVNEAVPQFYGQALAAHEVAALGRPEVEVTSISDGEELRFTAEVDVRPRFEVPDTSGMEVRVETASVTPDEVEEQLHQLRERFATLRGADRPARTGDFVSIDLSATADGEDLEDAQASGMSYEIGSGGLIDGLDDALVGLEAGGSTTFETTLAGPRAGQTAEVTVTVHSVKVKELPELDDEFAQTASEFDTIGELRADLRGRLERGKRVRQVGQARERALEALLARVDIPLPDSVVQGEIEEHDHNLDHQLQRIGLSRDDYLDRQRKSAEEYDAEVRTNARNAVKGRFVLDQLVVQEEIGFEQSELTDYVVEQAYMMGVPPDQLARRLTETGQLAMVVAEVLRRKALERVVERARVVDESGAEVDLAAIREEASAGQTVPAGAAGGAEPSEPTGEDGTDRE